MQFTYMSCTYGVWRLIRWLDIYLQYAIWNLDWACKVMQRCGVQGLDVCMYTTCMCQVDATPSASSLAFLHHHAQDEMYIVYIHLYIYIRDIQAWRLKRRRRAAQLPWHLSARYIIHHTSYVIHTTSRPCTPHTSYIITAALTSICKMQYAMYMECEMYVVVVCVPSVRAASVTGIGC